jgi:hypothetical protein
MNYCWYNIFKYHSDELRINKLNQTVNKFPEFLKNKTSGMLIRIDSIWSVQNIK